jgi:hypothetical protein
MLPGSSQEDAGWVMRNVCIYAPIYAPTFCIYSFKSKMGQNTQQNGRDDRI